MGLSRDDGSTARHDGPSLNARRAAKRLRRQLTEAEAKLWFELRRADLPGTRFRRQVPIGRYVADFACHRSHIVIEVDGATHSYDQAILRDRERTDFLESAGYRVIRFTNEDVLHDSLDVITTIVAVLREQQTQTPPSPLEGEVARRSRDGGGDAAPSTPRAAIR